MQTLAPPGTGYSPGLSVSRIGHRKRKTNRRRNEQDLGLGRPQQVQIARDCSKLSRAYNVAFRPFLQARSTLFLRSVWIGLWIAARPGPMAIAQVSRPIGLDDDRNILCIELGRECRGADEVADHDSELTISALSYGGLEARLAEAWPWKRWQACDRRQQLHARAVGLD